MQDVSGGDSMKKDNKNIRAHLKQIVPICAFLLGLYASYSKSASNYTEYVSAGYYVGKYISEVREKRLSKGE